MKHLSEQQLAHDDRRYHLLRYPISQNKTLRAWTAADIYCFDSAKAMVTAPKTTLIINDEHGALSHLFIARQPYFYSDSFLSNTALKKNLARNDLADPAKVGILDSLTKIAPNSLELLIINLPKSHQLLEAYIHAAKPLLKNDAWVIGSGMTKHIHNKTIAHFSENFGPTQTSLARQKARMIISRNVPTKGAAAAPPKTIAVENYGFSVVNLPGVFSYDSIDQAAYRFLPLLAKHKCSTAIDLGCGNGILGAMLHKANPALKLSCIDESRIALESTKETFLQNGWDVPELLWSHGLENYQGPKVETIVCNPPFHQQQTIVADLAAQMFHDAAQNLTREGSFLVIGNQHLGYQSILKRSFRVAKEIFRDAKFQIFQCRL